MGNPLADAAFLRAAWADGPNWHREDHNTLYATLTDAQLNKALDEAFSGFEYRYDVLREQMLAEATRRLTNELFTLCDECRRLIPNFNASEISSHHDPACSLHPENAAEG